jgi:hypothetical protein
MMPSAFSGDGDRSPEVLKAVFDPDLERRLLVQRPEEDGAHERLQDLNRDLFLLQARVDLAALLPGGHDLRDHPAALLHVVGNDFAHAGAGQK